MPAPCVLLLKLDKHCQPRVADAPLCIYVVDRKPHMRQWLTRRLREAGFTVEAFESVDMFVDYIRMDNDSVSKPGADSYLNEVLAFVRSKQGQGYSVPLIAVAAHAEESFIRRAFCEGLSAVTERSSLLYRIADKLRRL